MMTAFFYVADNGLLYAKYREGEMSKEQFWKKVRSSSIQTLGGVAGGAGGSTIGFAIGTGIYPGIGSIVGALLGGFVGGVLGGKLSL